MVAELETGRGGAAERLKALERLYLFELWQRMREVEATLERADWKIPPTGQREELLAVLESLASSARTFGLEPLSQATREFLRRLQRAAETPEGTTPGSRRALRRSFAALRAAAAQSEHVETPGSVSIGDELLPRVRKLLVLFEERTATASELTFQLGCFGFVVRQVREVDELERALPHAAAVIVDIDLEAPGRAGSAAMESVAAYRTGVIEPPPLILLSRRDDLHARVQAVRAGADAFFPLPLDLRDLVERLDVLVRRHTEEPFRVLLVEEDYATALGLVLLLQDCGMQVTRIDDAGDALPAVSVLTPDVVLTDLDLRALSGPELAAVIRQQRDFADLPVVYLSRGGGDLDRQLDAMRRGGDDLVSLADGSGPLLETVLHHAQRYRLLRHYRRCDALTGLLNFSSSMELLRRECARAERTGRPLVLALLDIDALDTVNAGAGYLVGDSVLRGLSGLLRQRFRRSDGIGRFGNRFLVLMPNTVLANATQILQETRVLFAEIHRQRGERPFTVTLSGGVAEARPGDKPQDVYRTARQALERARALGGDRVERARE